MATPKTKHTRQLFLAVWLLLTQLLTFSVSAADAALGSLTIDCSSSDCNGNDITWSLYHAADILGRDSIVLSDAFAGYSIQPDIATDAGLQFLSLALEAYADAKGIPPMQTKTAACNATLTFDALPIGVYLVTSIPVSGTRTSYSAAPFVVCIADGVQFQNEWRMQQRVFPKLLENKIPEPGNVIEKTVKIIWDTTEPPPEITILLYRDHELYDVIVLTGENNWEFTWSSLPGNFTWTVNEKGIPDNYNVTYTEQKISESKQILLITNTYQNPMNTTAARPQSTMPIRPEKLPQTGQLWWPVPVLAVAGLFLFGIGWRIRRS